MTDFSLPFIIEHPNKRDFVLAKCYEEKQECYKLTIPAGKQLEKAIYIKFKPTTNDLNLNLIIELGKGSSATIIEDWCAEVKSPTIRFGQQIKCHANSNLKYVVLNCSSQETKMTEKRSSDVASDAKCHVYTYHFGSKKLDSRLTQTAYGKGAEINTDIIAKSSADQDLSFNCEHDYAEKMGSGEIGMKGIAQGKAILSFDGLVNIRKTGSGSTGYLKQETLNLSPDTTVMAMPGLKIDTNDVKAGHSAAVRNLSDEDLYYFGARGIEKEMAKKLLITGFLGKELKKIEAHKTAYESIKKLI
ncbi:SufD family Fe-S cluster assembly protein [Patescibacteria group bacterium]|nr:SufD family Fe-S cluster assembly protein [Patescibacteria group bacterium]MBU1016304.1 SufD family Fe-S cluster assembly protein [Patescibacteria group bacterium]MBU1685580.1 SufD family Fe-S cluster assembly protein [Patescibacteria group bacterium]MBU1938505.1 SufD family Fe-S cluster assembly protein [Patescibacteria group bacterium]